MIQMLGLTVPASILAGATTAHLALLLLRRHRNPRGARHEALLLPGAALTAAPWLFSSVLGVGVGLTLHLAWVLACELLVVGGDQTGAAPAAGARPPARRDGLPAAGPQPSPAAARPVADGFVRTPVLAVVPETPDIVTVRMARPEGFHFSAGQFLTMRIQVDGKAVVRCYSVSSAPEATGYLEISVKRQGLVSGWIHSSVRPGSTLSIRAPAGGFVYPSDDDRPIVLLAGGVGITPLVSMLRHAVASEPERRVTLLYSVTSHHDVAFRGELRWIADRFPQVKLVVTMTRGPHHPEFLSGRIDRRMIAGQIEDLDHSLFMICGPGPMIEAMRATLSELGVDSGRIRSEAFEAAIAASAAPAASVTPPREAPGGPGPVDAGTGSSSRLRLVSSGRTVEVPDGRTLLEACEDAGVELPSACRAGVCGTCRLRLVDGRVDCPAGVDADGSILPCVSTALGDCAIEA